MRWSETETLKFVKIYLRHQCLWNPCHSGYKCRIKRSEAYADIISRFHTATGIVMNEIDLRIKIKNLRSTYAQEMAKIRQRSGPNFVYTPSIKWFMEWDRCFSYVRKGTCGLNQQEAIDDNLNQWNQPGDFDEQIENPHLYMTQSDDCLLSPKEEFSPETHENSYNIKRKKLKHTPSILTPSADSTVAVNEDEFDIYGKYIASQLRSMDLPRALKVQLDIHSIVSEARMSSLAGN